MQKTTLSMVIVVSLFLASLGCEKAKEAAQEVAKAAKAEPKVLKVKGLYLGMNIDEVPAILKNLLPKHEVSQVKGDRHEYVVKIDAGLGGAIIANKDKKVEVMSFSRAIVDDLFNSADMDAKSYAEKFMSSYNIPNMEPVPGKDWWQYTSPDGFKVSINAKYKITTIEKIAKEAERKFN